MARARRSSSVLKGTCSGFGTRPLDTLKQEHKVNTTVLSMPAHSDANNGIMWDKGGYILR